MKAVVFAGGIGTRLWPVSRKKSPKQFQQIVGEKSTLQLTVERLFPEFNPQDVYIATGMNYFDIVKEQLPMIPHENILGEPAMRDVGPAVGFVMGYLSKQFPNEPILILWSDHLVKETDKFKKIVKEGCALVKNKPESIIFIGQKPRFASENLGWITMDGELENRDGVSFKKFLGIKYRPSREVAEEYFKNPNYCWNLGYFISTPQYIYDLFKTFAPPVYNRVEEILSHKDAPDFIAKFTELYSQMPKINFDNAILEQMNKDNAYVVVDDIGWSDVGAWEALKEALEDNKSDNITKGTVHLEDSSDNLIYNYEANKIIVGVDLQDVLVVNTGDVLLVARKSSISKIKSVVESFQGTERDNLT